MPNEPSTSGPLTPDETGDGPGEMGKSESSASALFLLLLTYSVLPGVAKLLNRNAIFAGNIGVVAVLLWRARAFSWTGADLPVGAFAAWTALYLPLAFLAVPSVDGDLLMLGAFLFLVPMSGYVLARGYEFRTFAKAVAGVGVAHVAYGFVTYGVLPIPEWALAIREGTMAYRMASVSGSLGFSALALLTFVILLGYAAEQSDWAKRTALVVLAILALAGVALSMQRAVWLGAGVVLAVMLMSGSSSARRASMAVVVTFLLLVPLMKNAIEGLVDMSFVAERAESLLDARTSGGAIGERSEMWMSSVRNLLEAPLGLGLGQVGQATRILEKEGGYPPIVDGDYFKILSETGVPGGLLLAYLFACLALSFLKGATELAAVVPRVGLLGMLIQMVGSNVSELYFVNFLLWAFAGYVTLDCGRWASARVASGAAPRDSADGQPGRAREPGQLEPSQRVE